MNLLGDLLHGVAQGEPETVAFVDGDRRLTYAEWDWLSDRVAFSLWAEGIRPGDAVGLLLEASYTFPVCYLGIAKIGSVTVGINPRMASPEIDHILDASSARALITDRSMAADPMIFSPGRIVRPGGEPPHVTVAAEDPIAIVPTSGTTGLPKLAVFSARALDAVRRIETADEPDHPRGLQAIPMAHMGFMTKIAAFIARASTAVLMQRWRARDALDAIERERLTSIGGVPTQLAMMLADDTFEGRDLSSVQRVTIGGAPASPELVRRIHGAFGAPVIQRYSCTELGICTSTHPGDPDEVVATTVGRAQLEVDLIIANPNTDGIGEICVRSPAMFSGYRGGEPGIDADGMFHTADLGRIDAGGNLRLMGRAKDMYIRGGYNVYPLEVENALQQHPTVARAAVVAVPDDLYGECGIAYVQSRAPVDPAELRAFIAERIAAYKLPDRIVVRDSLPLTPMFKVDKRALERETSES